MDEGSDFLHSVGTRILFSDLASQAESKDKGNDSQDGSKIDDVIVHLSLSSLIPSIAALFLASVYSITAIMKFQHFLFIIS